MEKFKFNKNTDSLFTAIVSLKSVKEAEMFFCDLCTIDEIKEMSDRWQIAKLINLGWSYRKISDKLRVSTTTVARVALWLNNGEGGYRLLLDRLPKEHGLFPIFKKR